jgi:predicted RNase H-like HicB family nuclease
MSFRHFKVALPVIIIKEADQFVAYTPALELCTSGESIEEAKKNFEEIVTIFFDEISQAGTLNDVLSDLSWEKEDNQWLPPEIIAQSI